MLIPTLMLNTAAAMMVLMLMRYHMVWAHHIGQRGFVLMLAGIWMLPLDVLLDYLSAPSHIAFLLGPRYLHSPAYGLTAIFLSSLLYAYVVGAHRARQDALWVAGGYLVHIALVLATPEGLALLAPFWNGKVALPIHQEGHVVLIVILTLCITLLEGFPQAWRRVHRVTLGVVASYFLVGALTLGAMAYITYDLTRPGETWKPTPATPWLTTWQITYAGPQKYRVLEVRAGDGPVVHPESFFRFNEEGPLSHLLKDPLVQAFTHRWFVNPMYRVSQSDDRVTLMIEELPSVSPSGRGRSLMLEEDIMGGKPQYTAQGFIIDLPWLGWSD